MNAPFRSRESGASAWRLLYSLAWWLATPFLLGSLVWRARRQRGYLLAIPERFGFLRPRAAGGRLVWVHAVSVGETRAAEPLVRAMAARSPDVEFLLTHMTPTGRETGAAIFADLIGSGRMRQAWLAWDYPGATRRMLARARPVLGMLMETELWPNLVFAAKRARIPLALVNARLSDRSLRRGRRWGALIVPALSSLDRVIAQTAADAERLAELGRADVTVAGNVKFDITPPEQALERGRRWRQAFLVLTQRPSIVLAASTRDGEEAQLLKAWRDLYRAFDPALLPLLVLVPRHPQRFNEVAELARAEGFAVLRRSALDIDSLSDSSIPVGLPTCQVLVGDSMGEMFSYYAMADAAIMGGTLLPWGGQNLIEACAAGLPVVLGPHTFNFDEASANAVAEGAAVRVPDAEQAAHVALALVNDPNTLARAGECALRFATQHRGATDRTLTALQPLLSPHARSQ
jgi:3-deoxy-D-manno-octulosonic-acid transferase